MPFTQQMTFPCELTLRTTAEGVRIVRWPIEVIKDLYEKGLSGIEVYHPAHNNKHIRYFNDLCQELNIAATGGSDFHGRHKDRTELGKYAKKKFIEHQLWLDIKNKYLPNYG